MKTAELHLSGSRVGRVLLHLVCIARHGRLKWHFRGIAREFTASRAWAAS